MFTKLSGFECAKRLRTRCARWYSIRPTDDHPFKGRIAESGFRISCFHAHRHGGETEAVGRFMPDGGGTAIDLSLGWRRWDVIFLVLWFGVAMSVWVTLNLKSVPPGDPLLRWQPLLMILFGFLLMEHLRWQSRGEGQFLVELIGSICEANESGLRPIE